MNKQTILAVVRAVHGAARTGQQRQGICALAHALMDVLRDQERHATNEAAYKIHYETALMECLEEMPPADGLRLFRELFSGQGGVADKTIAHNLTRQRGELGQRYCRWFQRVQPLLRDSASTCN